MKCTLNLKSPAEFRYIGKGQVDGPARARAAGAHAEPGWRRAALTPTPWRPWSSRQIWGAREGRPPGGGLADRQRQRARTKRVRRVRAELGPQTLVRVSGFKPEIDGTGGLVVKATHPPGDRSFIRRLELETGAAKREVPGEVEDIQSSEQECLFRSKHSYLFFNFDKGKIITKQKRAKNRVPTLNILNFSDSQKPNPTWMVFHSKKTRKIETGPSLTWL